MLSTRRAMGYKNTHILFTNLGGTVNREIE
jgi:hypothetical protein